MTAQEKNGFGVSAVRAG